MTSAWFYQKFSEASETQNRTKSPLIFQQYTLGSPNAIDVNVRKVWNLVLVIFHRIAGVQSKLLMYFLWISYTLKASN